MNPLSEFSKMLPISNTTTRRERARQLFTWLNVMLILCIALGLSPTSFAADEASAELDSTISASSSAEEDRRIERRVRGIFAEIDGLEAITVEVSEGVVSLSGEVANDNQAEQAMRIASRFDSVVAIEDNINRTLAVGDNVEPVIDEFKASVETFIKALPLIGIALLVFIIIVFVGNLLAKWKWLWGRIAPNPFLSEIISQAVRVVFIILGLVTALNLVGATALMGTILGGAGVIGIAIGFAVRDTLENYISSIMLSLRQPFRANDRVVIGDQEGVVVRLTSRATILMTLEGNHLRIPNSVVFKSVILNYTRNPERRFDFELGVDAEDDPVAAMRDSTEAVHALDFVLDEPKPYAVIETVGDSNIVIRIFGWVDQTSTDFGKARSLAIRAAKDVLEENGFTLPEPIYRLRFDQPLTSALGGSAEVSTAQLAVDSDEASKPRKKPSPKPSADDMDVSPDTHLEEKASEERAEQGEDDLLDQNRPVE